jgi:hypothetical protein
MEFLFHFIFYLLYNVCTNEQKNKFFLNVELSLTSYQIEVFCFTRHFSSLKHAQILIGVVLGAMDIEEEIHPTY